MERTGELVRRIAKISVAIAWPAVWLSALFIVSRAVIFLFLAGRGSDLSTHHGYVAQIVEGRIPFRDFFPEYPPLVLLFTTIPAIVDPSLEWYSPLFRVLCCIIDCGIWAVLLLQLQQKRIGVWRLILYMSGTTVLGALIYDRIDIVLAAILLAAVISLRNGRDDSFHLAVGIGIAFKLIPVVFVPMALMMQWRKSDGQLLRALMHLALPTLISFAAIAALGGYRLDKMFEYHLQRGIQIESTPASIEMVLMMFGVDGKVTHGFGSFNLTTPWEPPLTAGATGMLGLMVLGSSLLVACKKLDQQALTVLFAAVLSAALALSKVLSPQFFLFLLPVLVTLPVDRHRMTAVTTRILIVVIYVLTGTLFPWWYGDLIALDSVAQFMVIVRNECLVALSVSLFYRALVSNGRVGVVDNIVPVATVVPS